MVSDKIKDKIYYHWHASMLEDGQSDQLGFMCIDA